MHPTDPGNGAVIELLEEIHHLMGLKGENPFKVRAFEKAAASITSLGMGGNLFSRAKAGTLTEIPGIGKGISEVITEFLLKGKSTVRDELKASLPEGLLELTQIPGLGPKRAAQLIEDLGVHSVGELEYACRENRLLKLKGFGEKAQHKVMEGIQFLKSNQGQMRLVDAFSPANRLLQVLARALNDGRHPIAQALRVSETGAIRRRLETLSQLDFLIEIPHGQKAAGEIRVQLMGALEKFQAAEKFAFPVIFHYATPERFGYELARLTGTPEHWKALGQPAPFDAPTEEDFFKKLGLPLIPPESRETGEEVALAQSGKISELLRWDGIQGIFHNHTTRSDGSATLEEMVLETKRLGYHYIGISDHSKSAFYAQGLKEDDLGAQEKEIRTLQDKYPEIRIFWGIESDILADGSLDYDPKWLKRFDFVIASVHSRFQMERETMTERVLEAVRNPHTRFLGHVTGRLLLGRKGYDLDMERVIAEAARHQVAIEINANPARLDIDWRWGQALRRCGTGVSVNPDAHDVQGLSDTIYGIAVARKALLPQGQVINARSVAEVEKWLKRI